MSFNLHEFLLIKYSLSPLRYNFLPTSTWLYSKGRSPLSFSTVKYTSQKPRGLTLDVPLKIRSSILELLNLDVLCSPRTHRIASTMFVLPQPFGPTIPVIPSLKTTVCFFAKDLKPKTSNFEICIIFILEANSFFSLRLSEGVYDKRSDHHHHYN